MTDDFKAYGQQVVDNARTLAESLISGGVTLVSGGTDNHLMLVNVFASLGIGGRSAEEILDRCGITTNKNMLPFDQRKPNDPSGVRIGTPALTSRGMGSDEMKSVGNWIVSALKNPEDEALHQSIQQDVNALCEQFPVPADQ